MEYNNNLTIFDLETDTQDNQLSLFDEIKENDPLEDLLSYGIDEYYKKHFSTGTPLLRTIQEELNKLPKYDEYYEKLETYLQKYLPLLNVCHASEINSKDKCMYYVGNNIIRVKGNREDRPIYCLSMVQKGILNWLNIASDI